MYADKIPDSMRDAIDETERRRTKQVAFNAEHGITPETVRKAVYALEVQQKDLQADAVELLAGAGLPREDLLAIVRDLEKEMRRLSRELAFEEAARVRDRIIAIRKRLTGEEQEDDADVALAIAAAPKARTSQVRNWRRSRRGP
jgi:excinuclease ABC subunit B